ncbi:hypothetical protein PAXRUDRAFT_76534, partial [Paxillus rubicundulus Ve08.2h10]
TGLSTRHLQECFQCDADTISKCTHCILNILVESPMYQAYVKSLNDNTPDWIKVEPKLFPFFKDCRGDIDGCHVS